MTEVLRPVAERWYKDIGQASVGEYGFSRISAHSTGPLAFKVNWDWKKEDGEQVNLDLLAPMQTDSSLGGHLTPMQTDSAPDDIKSLDLKKPKHQEIVIPWLACRL